VQLRTDGRSKNVSVAPFSVSGSQMIRHSMTAYSPGFVAKTGESKNNTSRLRLMDHVGRSLLRADRRINVFNGSKPDTTPFHKVARGSAHGRILEPSWPKEAETRYHED